MSEWQDISRKLGATPGVEELEVAGLSARGARVTLRYAEGAERLADALAQQGLSLRNAGRQLGARGCNRPRLAPNAAASPVVDFRRRFGAQIARVCRQQRPVRP